jgi:hypothetical protein
LGDCFEGLPSMAIWVGLTSRNLLLVWMLLQSGELCFAGGDGTQNRNYVLHPRGLLIWPVLWEKCIVLPLRARGVVELMGVVLT